MQKSYRKIIAKETLDILGKGFYTNQNRERVEVKNIQGQAVKETKLFTSENLDKLLNTLELSLKYKTSFEVREETTIQSLLRNISGGNIDPVCLNFASAKNPGGGFFNGAQAQEESIARSSGLYPCQIAAMDFYETHRSMKSCIYTDSMIYSPRVPIFRKDDGVLLDSPIYANIITAAAVNFGVVKRFESEKISMVEEIMKIRIDKLLALSAFQNHKTLILGAWGCGVFQNDPRMIAQIFNELLKGKYKGVFEKVVFAVYAKNKKFIQAFQNEFE